MANNYKKFALADFKEKLKDGGYAAIVGARRAIGKFADWSADDKDKARKIADAHFGVEAGAQAPAKRAKKAPAKKAGRKATKKAAAKAAPAKATVKKVPGKRGRKPKAITATGQQGAPRGRRRSISGQKPEGMVSDTIAKMTGVIGTMSDAVNSIRLAREMVTSDPKELDEALLTAARTIARALTVLDSHMSVQLQLHAKSGDKPAASERAPEPVAEAPQEEEHEEPEADEEDTSHETANSAGAPLPEPAAAHAGV